MRTFTSLATAAVVAFIPLLLPSGATAQDGRFVVTVHVEFSGDRTSDYRVGEPLMVQVKDTQGAASERQICWTPAPIDRPACSSSASGAPAQVGTQKLDITMSDGSKVSHTFAVGPAATVVKPANQVSSPVPFQVTCATPFYGDYGRDGFAMPLGTSAAGTQVAAYYSPGKGVYQVVTLNTFVAGFVSTSCLRPVSAGATRTQTRPFALRSNTTQTYFLKIPAGFTVIRKGDAGGVSYAIDVKGGGFGNGVANPIFARGGGVHLPFLGATVIGDGYDAETKRWFVRVRTGKLAKPLTLQITAYGRRSTS